MKKIFTKLVTIICILYPTFITSQTINVAGFDGLTFEVTQNDYTIQITNPFNLHNTSIQPVDLTLSYIASEQKFLMNGTLKVEVDSNQISVSLGDLSTPGIIIENQVLTQVKFKFNSGFNISGSSFSSDNLQLVWRNTGNNYRFLGECNLDIGGNELQVIFGEEDSSYVTFAEGKIVAFAPKIKTRFQYSGIHFLPVSLSVDYDRIEKQLKIYGFSIFLLPDINAGDTSVVNISFGTQDSAKFIIKNNSIVTLGMNVMMGFVHNSIYFESKSLDMEYNNGKFVMYGDASFILSGMQDTIAVSFGSGINDGLIIESGNISQFSIGVIGEFNIKGVKITSNGLTMFLNNTSKTYDVYGSCKVIVESDTIVAQLGTEQLPGFIINMGALEQLNIGITGNFNVKGLLIQPNDLTFYYNKSTSNYEMYGSCNTIIESDTVTVSLGDLLNPGIIVSNGSFLTINFGVSGNFGIKKITIIPQSLTFWYNNSFNQFEIYGSCTVLFESDSIDVTLGDSNNPGFVFKNGTIQRVEFGLSGSFYVKEILVKPTALTFAYNKTLDNYTMYGFCSITVDGESFVANLGNAGNPGLSYANGAINSVNFGITGNIRIKSLQIEAINLTFTYNKTNSYYNMYGDCKAILGSDFLNINMGTLDNPGLVYQNGTIKNINFGFTGEFEIKGVKIEPSALSFNYNNSSSKYDIYGSCKVIVENDTIISTLGTEQTPGFLIKSGELEQFNIGISGNFKLKGIEIQPNGLTFFFNKATNKYEMYGSCNALVETDTIAVTLGDETNPGITYASGTFMNINFGITGHFNIKNTKIIPDSLTFYYNKTASKYEMFGSCKVMLESDTLNVYLGDSNNPGFEVLAGTLVKLNFGITGKFKIKAVEVSPINLTFGYEKDSSNYKMYGSCRIIVETDTMLVSLGTESSPGLSYKDGHINKVNFGISGHIKIKELSIFPNNLTFAYDETNESYKMFGTCSIDVENDKIGVNLGTAESPGFLYSDGRIQNINFGITGEFTVKKISIKPTGLSFEYNRSASSYDIYGECKISLEGKMVDVSLGTASDVGFRIISGSVNHINFGITGDFQLKMIDFAPKGLTFEWDKPTNQFKMYGAAKISVESDIINIGLGTITNPGIVVDNGSLVSLNASLTSDFEMKGLSIKTKDLTFVYNSLSDHYEVYGTAGLNFSGDEIDVNFGDSTNPGLNFYNGSLNSFNIGITSDIKLGTLEVKTKNLGCSYNSTSKKYFLSGSVELDMLYSLIADFGTDGIEIDVSQHPDKLKINSLVVELDNAQLGSIDLKQIKLTFDSQGIQEADLKVVFPLGWEVDADMTFTGTPQTLNSITIDFIANNIEDAIEIPGTGAAVSKISGSLQNINDASNLSFYGDVVLCFAGPETISGYELALAELEASFTIDKSHIYVSTTANIGAYQKNNAWHSLLGSGSLTANVKFSGTSTLELDVKIPSDPLVEFDAKFNTDKNKDFNALLDVTFYVPSFVPYFGGKKLGGIDGGFRWKNGNMNDSYVAAWKHYNFYLKKGYVGAKYNFGSRSLSKIGTGTVNSIENELGSPMQATLDKTNEANKIFYRSIIRTFELPNKSPDMALLTINWGRKLSTAYVTVMGNEGAYELIKYDLIEESLDTDTLQFTRENNFSKIINDSSVIVGLMPPNSTPNGQNGSSYLLPGQYQLIFSFPATVFLDSVDLIIDSFFPSPKGTITAVQDSIGKYNLNLNYFAYLDDSIKVNFYWNDTTLYNGILVDSEVYFSETDTGYVNAQVSIKPEKITDGRPIYFYAIIEDGVNPPYGTNFSTKFTHQNPVNGYIYDISNSILKPASGITVYLDESANAVFDTNSVGIIEFADITDSTGAFEFNRSLERSNRISAIIPYGYEIDSSSPNQLPFIWGNTGTKENVIIYIRKKTSEMRYEAHN